MIRRMILCASAVALLMGAALAMAQAPANDGILIEGNRETSESVERIFATLTRVESNLVPVKTNAELDKAMAMAISKVRPAPATVDCGLSDAEHERNLQRWPQTMEWIGCQGLVADEAAQKGSTDWVIPAITSFVKGIDPQGDVLSTKALEGAERFAWVGLSFFVEGDAATITRVRIDSPFAPLGLKRGDQITGVDGKPVNGNTVDTVVEWLRGAAGTPIKLDVRRAGSAPFSLTANRTVFGPEKTVPIVRDGMALIAFEAFNQDQADQLRDAVLPLQKSARAIVFDMRGNSGGLLHEVIACAGLFVTDGLIARIEGRPESSENFNASKAKKPKKFNALPLFVLIDKRTASGGEVFAAALQDRAGAILVGEPTFKTGVIRTVFPIDRDWLMTLTTARIIRPNGKPIDGVGVAPDIALDPQSDQDWPNLAMAAVEARLSAKTE
jgi:carboxyl-terminal processing protease